MSQFPSIALFLAAATSWAAVTSEFPNPHRIYPYSTSQYKALNVGQQWNITFDGRGFAVNPTGSDSWRWGLELESYGFGRSQQPAASPRSLAKDNRFSYFWNQGLVEEWFVNGEDGLEHGFTIVNRPATSQSGPLRVQLKVRGNLVPRLAAADGSAVVFEHPSAKPMRYEGLKAWDAEGRTLATRMETSNGGLAILVDEADAKYPITIDPIAQQSTLVPQGVGAEGFFGTSVAISGDTMVVGAAWDDSDGIRDSGAAFVYTKQAGSWVLQAKLRSRTPAENDLFGIGVAVSGDIIAVGSDVSATRPGAGGVFLFTRSTAGSWTQEAFLQQIDPCFQCYFGRRLGLSGNTLLVGAPGGNRGSGSAEVFVRSTVGGIWTRQAILTVPGSATNDLVGDAVSLEGNIAAIGAPRQFDQAGAAYIFARNATTGSWTLEAQLRATGGRAVTFLGGTISLSGNMVAVGAPGAPSSVAIFERTATGWAQQTQLIPEGKLLDGFGSSVSLSGNQLAVGVPYADDGSLADSGTVSIFERSARGSWSLQQTLKGESFAIGYFGYAVAIADGVLAVTNPGAANGRGSMIVASITPWENRGLHFVPLAPCRAADTRSTSAIRPKTSRDFGFSACNLPANAAAVSVNVTAIPQGPLAFLTVWPAGDAQPVASTLNSLDGRIKASSAITAIGASQSVSIYVTDSAHVVLDVTGYFVPAGTPGALAYYPATACRALDTRSAGGVLLSGETRKLSASNVCFPPRAQAYVLNVTAVPPNPGASLGFLTVWPDGTSRPLASTLNNLTGTVVANSTIVPAAPEINFYATDPTHLVVDSSGYFAPPGLPGASAFYVSRPCRMMDTRNLESFSGGPALRDGETRELPTSLIGCGVPANASAVAVQATVIPSGQFGFLTLWGPGERPVVSTLNAVDGAITSNSAIVSVGAKSAGIRAFGSNAANLVIDLSGYFGQQ